MRIYILNNTRTRSCQNHLPRCSVQRCAYFGIRSHRGSNPLCFGFPALCFAKHKPKARVKHTEENQRVRFNSGALFEALGRRFVCLENDFRQLVFQTRRIGRPGERRERGNLFGTTSRGGGIYVCICILLHVNDMWPGHV